MEKFKGFMKNRYSLAIVLAIIATVFGITAAIMMYVGTEGFLANAVAYGWIFSTLAAYICGGLFKAIGMILNFASRGLLIGPVWLGFCMAGILLVCGLVLFLFIPIIPVYKAAQEYGVSNDN